MAGALATVALGAKTSAALAGRRRAVRAQAAAQTSKPEAEPATAGNRQEIYIGFAKGDYAPRQGRKGRVIIDDARRYPERNEYTGGWAGGEAGLKQFIEELKREEALNAYNKSKDDSEAAARAPQPLGKGNDTIYLGKGRTIKADARKYPGRDSVTGGFAGGELGLKAYVASGDVPIADGPGGRRQPQSPLIVAGIVALAATAGGILVSDVGTLGERALSGAAGAPLPALSGVDDTTKLLLEVAVLLVGAAGTVAGARALVSGLTNSLREGAAKLATLAVFWLAVFVAARFVLESS